MPIEDNTNDRAESLLPALRVTNYRLKLFVNTIVILSSDVVTRPPL
jgi:hypothetical protein